MRSYVGGRKWGGGGLWSKWGWAGPRPKGWDIDQKQARRSKTKGPCSNSSSSSSVSAQTPNVPPPLGRLRDKHPEEHQEVVSRAPTLQRVLREGQGCKHALHQSVEAHGGRLPEPTRVVRQSPWDTRPHSGSCLTLWTPCQNTIKRGGGD